MLSAAFFRNSSGLGRSYVSGAEERSDGKSEQVGNGIDSFPCV